MDLNWSLWTVNNRLLKSPCQTQLDVLNQPNSKGKCPHPKNLSYLHFFFGGKLVYLIWMGGGIVSMSIRILMVLMMMTWISQSLWWWWWWDGVHIFDVNGCGGYLVEPYCIQDTSVTLWEAGYPHLDILIYRQRPKDFVLGNCWDVEMVTSFLTFGYISNCSKESKDLILGCINEGFMQGF